MYTEIVKSGLEKLFEYELPNKRVSHLVGSSVALLSLVLLAYFSYTASANNSWIYYKYNKTLSEISSNHTTYLTPVDWTFSIWGLIFAMQAFWLVLDFVYSAVKKSNKNKLPYNALIYVPVTLANLFGIFWVFAWMKEHHSLSFFIILCIPIFLHIAFEWSNLAVQLRLQHKTVPVWLGRYLIFFQVNGLLIYYAWSLLATLLSANIVMIYKLGKTDLIASSIVLCLLNFILFLSFVWDFVLLKKLHMDAFGFFLTVNYYFIGLLAKLYDNMFQEYFDVFVVYTFIVALAHLLKKLVLKVYFCFKEYCLLTLDKQEHKYEPILNDDPDAPATNKPVKNEEGPKKE